MLISGQECSTPFTFYKEGKAKFTGGEVSGIPLKTIKHGLMHPERGAVLVS